MIPFRSSRPIERTARNHRRQRFPMGTDQRCARSAWRAGIYRDADFVLEVSDPLDLAGGRFLLQILEGIGKCMPHDGPPDIEIGLADLATVYMGAHRASQLLRTDRITELRPGALQELDATFTVERAP